MVALGDEPHPLAGVIPAHPLEVGAETALPFGYVRVVLGVARPNAPIERFGPGGTG
jgi:hypothetical protein